MTHTAEAERLRRIVDELDAVRRVATMVTAGAPSAELYSAVLEEVVGLLGVTGGWLLRYEPGRTVAVLASLSDPGVSAGDRWPVDGHGLAAMVLEAGTPVRIDDVSDLAGTIATHARESGFRSAFGAPITVDGSMWGLMCVGSSDGDLLPADTEDRLREFIELLGAAISNAESRDRLRRLADGQASLRRVATLVAEDASATDLFAAAAEVIMQMLGLTAISIDRYEADRTTTVVAARNARAFRVGSRWPLDGPCLSVLVLDGGRPARIDDYSQLPGVVADAARDSGITAAAGAPILVDGGVWGMIWAGTTEHEPLPDGTEARLADVAELVGIAIANTQSRERLRRLAEQQASLRRVATLAAEGAGSEELFVAVAEEAARILNVLSVSVSRFEPDGSSVVVGSFNDPSFVVGTRWPLDAGSLNAMVLETGRSARIDDFSQLTGAVADAARAAGAQSGLGVPIVVDGSVWGMVAVGRRDRRETLPVFTGNYTGRIVLATESTADIEARLAAFTELVGTAISRAQAQDDLRTLASEQAALRRVATLVAEAAPREEIFTVVAEEVSRLFGLSGIEIVRYGPDDTATVIANHGGHLPVGSRWPLDGPSVMQAVRRTGRPARVAGYDRLAGTVATSARSSGVLGAIGAPIVVGGATWGAILAISTGHDPIAESSEKRLGLFTDLVATAISNAQARGDLEDLAKEQAALRRVATLVARESSPEDVFWSVIEEVRDVLGADGASLLRYHDDYSRTELADTDFATIGERTPLGGHNASTLVFETGGPVRMDDYGRAASGPSADHALQSGWQSCVAVPLNVEGHLWGVVMAASKTDVPLPPDAEERLAKFTELVATSIANAEGRAELAASEARARELAREQAALRRLATLVAEGVSAETLFSAVAEEVGQLLGARRAYVTRYEPVNAATLVAGWDAAGGDVPVGLRFEVAEGGAAWLVRRAGRPARVDAYAPGSAADTAAVMGIETSVGAPIHVEGDLWGLVLVGANADEPLPPDTEARLEKFTELVATAVSNASARTALSSLADEQAALRRVATLVARGTGPDPVFRAVASEVSALMGADGTAIVRFDDEGKVTSLADVNGWYAPGARLDLDPEWVVAAVRRTRRAARFDTDDPAAPGMPELVRVGGIRSGVATPVIVEGELWGTIVIASFDRSFPQGAERRLVDFTDLVATAVANAQAREQVTKLADEQAALRRLATRVAEGVEPAELVAGVAAEVARLLGVSGAQLDRYEPYGTTVIVASFHEPGWEVVDSVLHVGLRWSPGPGSLTAAVRETGRAARIDDYTDVPGQIGEISRSAGIGSACGAPIVVDGELWGAIRVLSRRGSVLPPNTEARLEAFTEIVATAVSNATARAALSGLASERAALHRVAALVAAGTDSASLFDAVCEEAGRLVGAATVNLSHYTADGFNVTMAGWSDRGIDVPAGSRFPITDDTIGGKIVRTRAPARIDSWEDATSDLGSLVRARGIRSSLGAPVVVEGRLWGALVAGTDADEPLPPETEVRLARFAELTATAVSNASTRAELIASRARIVTAGDEARRRIERNLHDGTQQRLIALGLDLQAVRATIPPELESTQEGFDRMAEEIESVLDEVRELSRGLHPAQLSRGGLGPSLRALARRSPIPVEVEVDVDERPPPPVETAVYYVVSEALTNAIRYSGASAISVAVRRDGEWLRVTIGDDGSGGAEPGAGSGSGLIGLSDRVEALGGRFLLLSPGGSGTQISVELPVAAPVAP